MPNDMPDPRSLSAADHLHQQSFEAVADETATLIAAFGASVHTSLVALFHLSETMCSLLNEPTASHLENPEHDCLTAALALCSPEPSRAGLSVLLADARRHAHELQVVLALSVTTTQANPYA